MNRPIRSDDDVVTCFRDGIVTLRKNRRVSGFTESLKEIGYQGVRRGDLVIHAMDAFAGAIGVSDSEGKCTPVYAVCQPREDVNSHYYAYIVREMARSQWIAALAKGIRERSTDFRFDGFASQNVPIPPREEQDKIAIFIDHIDRRIRRYIRSKQKLNKLLRTKTSDYPSSRHPWIRSECKAQAIGGGMAGGCAGALGCSCT
jgi:type I restriction enzyme S subunit